MLGMLSIDEAVELLFTLSFIQASYGAISCATCKIRKRKQSLANHVVAMVR